jgi:C-terminal processing protease CtpA/Prc
MVIFESQIQEALDQLLKEVQDNVEAAEAVKCFQTMVNDQREALQARLQIIGGSEPSSTSSIAPFSMTATLPDKEGTHKVSKALRIISTMFNHAAFGYALLHTTAHLFNDGIQGTGEGNTADMAEKHRRSYADASQAIYRLIQDVVIWEIGKDGECECICPACSLGICLCWHAHDDSLIPVAPAEGILMRSPKANSAAHKADLRQGDVILTADDHQMTPWWEIQSVISKHEPGEEIRLLVKRGPGEPLEVTITRPK